MAVSPQEANAIISHRKRLLHGDFLARLACRIRGEHPQFLGLAWVGKEGRAFVGAFALCAGADSPKVLRSVSACMSVSPMDFYRAAVVEPG